MLLASLTALALVLFVIPPGHVQAQQNQTTIKSLGDLNANSLSVQNTPLNKVHVGDIDVAYKMFGKGDPILLIPGASDGLSRWDSDLLNTISSNHTVIVFDPRGIGNTTIGSRSYTPSQLANDTTGLMDVLKISKASVMGYSLGSYIAQQVTMMYPDKVNSLVLIGSSCGGKDHTPKPSEFIKLQSDIINKSLNHITLPHEELQALNVASLGKHWEDNPNWNGACDDLAKLDKPTLVITGSDDNFYQPHVNSLKIAEKIPGAWLVQIKNAG